MVICLLQRNLIYIIVSRFAIFEEEPFVEKSRVARDSGDRGISSDLDWSPLQVHIALGGGWQLIRLDCFLIPLLNRSHFSCICLESDIYMY
jgi:hypothetical protein